MRIYIIIFILLMIGHHKMILLIRINELMLWFYKKNFTTGHFLKSKFVCQLGLTRVHIIISFLFMVRNHKLIFLIGINDIDASLSQEKLLFLPFSELMFVHWFGQTRIHIIISFFLVIGHHKHILVIGIKDIEALVS